MVIELSGEQFGLKSYACFKNRTSSQREFDLKSQLRPKLHDTKFNYHLITFFRNRKKFSRPDIDSCKCCLPFSCNLICFLKQALKYDWSLWFSKAVSLAGEKTRFRAQNGVIR